MELIIVIITIILGLPTFILTIMQIKKHANEEKNVRKTKVRKKENNVKHVSTQEIVVNNVKANTIDSDKKNSSMNQSNILSISDMQIDYIPLIGSWKKGENEYAFGEVEINQVSKEYEIPKDFLRNFALKDEDIQRDIIENKYEPKVRLHDYSIKIYPGKISNKLKFSFSEIKYSDYLITNNYLDDEIPNQKGMTFRDKYFNDQDTYSNMSLSNICGVGVFILTSDNKIIITKTSNYVEVNPNRYAFSASGTMDWNDNVHPFYDIVRECEEEIDHQINIENLKLFSFGIDYRKAYLQFLFFEKTTKSSDEIIRNATMARDFHAEVQSIECLNLDPSSIVNHVNTNKWEPISLAGILTIACKELGKKKIENAINPHAVKDDYRNKMMLEWEHRALRKGKLAALSNRFPSREIDKISDDYTRAVMDFINDDLSKMKVIEAGCGIGLLTRDLTLSAKKVIAIDISSSMIERNKNYIGSELSNKVTYYNCFVQDFPEKEKGDIVISSLMLTHNTDQEELLKITDKISRLANIVYLFEPLDIGIQASASTKPKSVDEYVSYFPDFGISKIEEQFLFTDKIAFIKLVRLL